MEFEQQPLAAASIAQVHLPTIPTIRADGLPAQRVARCQLIWQHADPCHVSREPHAVKTKRLTSEGHWFEPSCAAGPLGRLRLLDANREVSG